MKNGSWVKFVTDEGILELSAQCLPLTSQKQHYYRGDLYNWLFQACKHWAVDAWTTLLPMVAGKIKGLSLIGSGWKRVLHALQTFGNTTASGFGIVGELLSTLTFDRDYIQQKAELRRKLTIETASGGAMEAYREFCEALEYLFDFLTLPLESVGVKRLECLEEDEIEAGTSSFFHDMAQGVDDLMLRRDFSSQDDDHGDMSVSFNEVDYDVRSSRGTDSGAGIINPYELLEEGRLSEYYGDRSRRDLLFDPELEAQGPVCVPDGAGRRFSTSARPLGNRRSVCAAERRRCGNGGGENVEIQRDDPVTCSSPSGSRSLSVFSRDSLMFSRRPSASSGARKKKKSLSQERNNLVALGLLPALGWGILGSVFKTLDHFFYMGENLVRGVTAQFTGTVNYRDLLPKRA
ncbi:unnamed protein product, partial [Amoebophrya sp. A120]